MNSIKLIFESKLAQFATFLFVLLSVWWLVLILIVGNTDTRQVWAASYQVVALYGAIIGLVMSKDWGGAKSVLGRAIMSFSLGLLLQSFGQCVYSYYIFFEQIEVPYPSIGDLGFFGAIPAYIYGIWLLSKATNAKLSVNSFVHQLGAILIPLGMLTLSYFVFLNGHSFEGSSALQIFLDFGYPFGQAIYVSLAILTFLLSRKELGGLMKGPIRFLIFALIFQYISDYTFLYQASRGTWSVGGINDYLYLVSYFLMTLGLLYVGRTFLVLRNVK